MNAHRPRANQAALRIIASPYNGWLYGGDWYSEEEWYRAQRNRRRWRESKQRAIRRLRAANEEGET